MISIQNLLFKWRDEMEWDEKVLTAVILVGVQRKWWMQETWQRMTLRDLLNLPVIHGEGIKNYRLFPHSVRRLNWTLPVYRGSVCHGGCTNLVLVASDVVGKDHTRFISGYNLRWLGQIAVDWHFSVNELVEPRREERRWVSESLLESQTCS